MSIPEIDLPVYEAMARKDLSFGCYVQKNKWSNSNEPLVWRITSDPSGFCTWDQMGFNAEYMGTYSTTIFGTYVLNQKDDDGNKKWKVIGHEILLSDVLNYIEKLPHLNWVELYWNKCMAMNKWNLSLPYYSQQSEECKAYIRSLI